jgi:hypothetical protein
MSQGTEYKNPGTERFTPQYRCGMWRSLPKKIPDSSLGQSYTDAFHQMHAGIFFFRGLRSFVLASFSDPN